MESPQEVEVWYVLPALRKALAEEMLKLGLKQKEIAEKLHVTGAAISQYLKSKRAANIKFPQKIRKAIQISAKSIAKSDAVMAETQKLCTLIRKHGLLCKIHKRHTKCDLKKCEVCK
ncbi:MAG: helix-turn-helix domain-containing protein [archaeon]